MVILIAILSVVLLVLIINVFLWLSMLSGGMMMGMHGMMNDQMIQACIKMMQNH
jgi:hypothetical protein